MSNPITRLLNIFQGYRRMMLRLQGKTVDDYIEERVVTGKTWAEFCDQLKSAGGRSCVSRGSTRSISAS